MEGRALVVLGCAVLEGGAPSAALSRRIAYGAATFDAHLVDSVIVSGGRLWSGVSEADAMARALVARGVPEGRIHLERMSLSTRENAQFSVELARELGLDIVRIATCEWHLRRALSCFEALGIRAVGVGAPAAPTTLSDWALRRLLEVGRREVDLRVLRGWSRPHERALGFVRRKERS